MVFILVIIIAGYGGESISVTTQEFDTARACRVASKQVVKMELDRFTKIEAICVSSS